MSAAHDVGDEVNPVETLAAHVVGTRFEDLPQAAVQAAKTFILDSIGVGVAGSDGPWIRELIETVKGWGTGDEARVLVHGTRLPAASAAIVNAYQIHCLEYDCVNEDAVIHPMATILGAVTAEADRAGGYSGKDLILAVALGVDASCVLGISSRAPMRFFRPSTAGAFGATAAIAKLRGFDEPTLINAFGAIYGQISGTLAPHREGSPVLGMQIGFCARGAISACDLAQAGLVGPHEVITGMYGYLPMYEGDYDHVAAFASLGKTWLITRVSHKPFPSGRLTHGVVDGILQLQKNEGLKPEQVDRMMAHRLFLTSEAPAKSTVTRKREVPFPEVTVLMGDPRLPDSVKLGGQFNPEDLDTIERLKEALGEMEGVSFKYLDNHQSLWTELRTNQPSFVLNLCDEGFNNDAFLELHVPAMLEILGVPYSGAAPAALGLCYDKSLVRAVAQSLDVPVPSGTFFDPSDQAETLPGIFPAMIKPNFGDSSIGITKNAVVRTPEEAINYINELRELLPNRPLLVQEYLEGAEYSVGVIGNPGFDFHVMPVLEVDYTGLDAGLPKILGYESKWDPSSAYWTQIKYKEAVLSEEDRRLLADNSRALFDRLGCRDYARFDFRADAAGRIKLLEVNPNPGWSWDAKMNIMAGFEGLRYSDLLRMIVEAAQARVAAQRGSVPAA